MAELARFGVSCEAPLLKKFDRIIEKKGYTNRSEAIRDMVRDLINETEVQTDHGPVVGTLTILYDHDAGDVTHELLHIQHHHHGEISSTVHIHVDEHNCLEVLVVRGDASEVRELADNIRAIRGIKLGRLVMTSPGL